MCLLTVARALEMKQIDFLSKKEVWDKLQAMNGELEEHLWVDISDTDFGWWRWVANIACNKIRHGVSQAFVKKKQRNWYQLQFINLPDPTQLDSYLSDFYISLWKTNNGPEDGVVLPKHLKTRVMDTIAT